MSKETKKSDGPAQVEASTPNKKPTCGIVMPIGTMGDCSVEHWNEVRQVLSDAGRAAGFECSMVSDSEDVGIIQKRIVQNIYNNDIILCDVSHKNPNVMFELGMRLAFDKPAVIVKDDVTEYSFDTGIVEHVEYPRDMRFRKIVDFKDRLTVKLKNTYEQSQSNPEYSTFLKSFVQFKPASIDTKVVTSDQVVLNLLDEVRGELSTIKTSMKRMATETNTGSLLKGLDSQSARNYLSNTLNDYLNLYCKERNIESYQAKTEDVLSSLPPIYKAVFGASELKKMINEFNCPF